MGEIINYAYIDGNNSNLGIRDLGWLLDYRKLRIYLKDKYKVKKAYIFLGFIPENKNMYAKLTEYGFYLIFKEVLKDKDGKVKGNCDAEMVLQAMIDYPRYSRAVIITSDGDFGCLVRYLYSMAKLEKVLSPNQQKCSSLLKKAAREKIVFMNNLKCKLSYSNEKAPQ